MVPTWEQQQSGDVNGNGVVDAADATMILYHAAHGSWPLPGDSGLQLLAASDSPVTVSLDDVSGMPGETVQTMLHIENSSGWAGGEFAIAYNTAIIDGITVAKAGLANDLNLEFHDDGSGLVRIAIASSTPITGSGMLAALNLRIASNALRGTSVPLALSEAKFNDVVGRDFATSALQRTIVRRSAQLHVSEAYNLYLPVILKER